MSQTEMVRHRPASPLSAAGSFFNGTDQDLFRRFFGPLWASYGGADSFQTQGFVPAVDVAESADSYVLRAELPGLKKNDIEITLENQALTLAGERRVERTDDVTLHRCECGYGRFSRTFLLPRAADTAKIKASFKDGILTVTVPKAPEAQAKRIVVH